MAFLVSPKNYDLKQFGKVSEAQSLTRHTSKPLKFQLAKNIKGLNSGFIIGKNK